MPHGVAAPRGLRVEAGRGELQGRFGRMFPPRRASLDSDKAIEQLVALMATRAPAAEQRENFHIPAGFTYLGQFIDHDITFDPTSRRDRQNDPRALVDFRTPRFDLDSVYGAGPSAQPYLYDWESEPTGMRLLVARGTRGAPDDLPRNRQHVALTGDPRNDENVIVSQLQLLFLKFHNAVLDRVMAGKGVAADELFEEVQRIVRWHYQWIVLHEYLPAITELTLPVHRRRFRWKGDRPFLPMEFSGAVYRFGHSMIRNEYVLQIPPAGVMPIAKPIFPDLRGRRRLTKELEIDWERFFELEGSESMAQASFTIDTCLSRPLLDLELPGETASLARRNLERGRALGLPSGQEVARTLRVKPLPEESLRLEKDAFTGRVRKRLVDATPLWYYVLCEAEEERQGKRLGRIGARIVAEVLAGLAEGDPSSFLRRQPDWRPELGEREDENGERDFKMADLIAFVREAEAG